MTEKTSIADGVAMALPDSDTRRRFLCKLGGIAGSAALMRALPACDTLPGETSTVYVKPQGGTLDFDVTNATYKDLATVGNTVSIDTHGQKIIMIRSSATEVTVLSRMCPHADCDMSTLDSGDWDQSQKHLTCLCHSSVFDASGNILSGPSKSGLRHYMVAFDGTKGTVTL